jgi:hypothetical protein
MYNLLLFIWRVNIANKNLREVHTEMDLKDLMSLRCSRALRIFGKVRLAAGPARALMDLVQMPETEQRRKI